MFESKIKWKQIILLITQVAEQQLYNLLPSLMQLQIFYGLLHISESTPLLFEEIEACWIWIPQTEEKATYILDLH